MIAIHQPGNRAVRWVHITKRRARERWANGDAITLVPCKCHPSSPWGLGVTVDPAAYMERAEAYGPESSLWAGSVEATAWNLMYNNWAYYNTSYEMGAYAHYYVAKPLPKRELCEAHQ